MINSKSCSSSPAEKVWKAFARWGDQADYWVAPGGDFETRASGWDLSNSRVVAGNEDQGVVEGRRSLALGMGVLSGRATAVSPVFCITEEHPTFRYVFKPTGAAGVISTYVRYTAADGSTQTEKLEHSKSALTLLPGVWQPSDLQPLATDLPMKKLNGVAKVQLIFASQITVLGAGYQIDSVLVDPYRNR